MWTIPRSHAILSHLMIMTSNNNAKIYHLWQLAAFLQRYSGPIRNHRQYSSAASMGPCQGIDSISWGKQQAYSRSSAVFFSSHNGPIWDHWQHSLEETVGLFMTIGWIFWQQQWAHSNLLPAFMSNSGPIQPNGPLMSGAMVGPFKAIVTKSR